MGSGHDTLAAPLCVCSYQLITAPPPSLLPPPLPSPQIWKVFKAFHISIVWGLPPRLSFGTRTSEELKTAAFDSQSMTYLSYLLYPLCVAGAVYSLLYTPHKRWVSGRRCVEEVGLGSTRRRIYRT